MSNIPYRSPPHAEIKLQAVGTYRSPKLRRLHCPPQSHLVSESTLHEHIEWLPNESLRQAARDLERVTHIWILFAFLNKGAWRPTVRPPRGSNKRIGVFATRSPYRPNPIGMSVTRVLRTELDRLWVAPTDILDGTPILDVKPYHPEADVVAGARIDWMTATRFDVVWSPQAQLQLELIEGLTGDRNVRNTVHQQLEFEPTDKKRKRVRATADGNYRFSYRTWRFDFRLTGLKSLEIFAIRSGYSSEELSALDDPWGDKAVHRAYTSAEITL